MDSDLLADLDDLGDDIEELEEDLEEMETEIDAHQALLESVKGANNVHRLLQVHGSNELKNLIKVFNLIKIIQSFQGQQRETSIGNVEDDPEYQTIVEANAQAYELSNEAILVQKVAHLI